MRTPYTACAARPTLAALLAAVAMLAAGCQATPCREGDNGRFRCDTTAAARAVAVPPGG